MIKKEAADRKIAREEAVSGSQGSKKLLTNSAIIIKGLLFDAAYAATLIAFIMKIATEGLC